MDKTIENIKIILKESYQLNTISVKQIQGGWSALAYIAEDSLHRKFLLKVYDKARTSTKKLTSKIENYLPVLEWLNLNTGLLNKIIYPLRTITGEFKYENEYFIFLLFKYIEGNNVTDTGLNNEQITKLASIVAELHCFGEDIPLETIAIKEDYEIDFCDSLSDIINIENRLKHELKLFISPYLNRINDTITQVTHVSTKLQSRKLKKVFCHTDIHEGNIIQGKYDLVLIDWEGLKLAPPEADFFDISKRTWSNIFFEKYKEIHPDYLVDSDCLRFYQLKRKLEDIWEFIEQLQYDKLTIEEEAKILNYLQMEYSSIDEFFKDIIL